MKYMIKIFGVPHRIISERGKAFTSEKFKNFCREIGATHHLNVVAIP